MVNNITLLESADKDERNDVFFVRLTGIGEQQLTQQSLLGLVGESHWMVEVEQMICQRKCRNTTLLEPADGDQTNDVLFVVSLIFECVLDWLFVVQDD